MTTKKNKISVLDLKAFLNVIQTNLYFIVFFSLLGFVIGYFFIIPNQDQLKVTSFVKYDHIKHQIFIDEFDINISETFPQYVNKYFIYILDEDQKAAVNSFVIKDGGIYDTKIIAVMSENDIGLAEKRFTKLYNSILDEYELEIYSEYHNKIENIKHAYNAKNENIYDPKIEMGSLDNMLNEDDRSNLVISYLLGLQHERSLRSEANSKFVESNNSFEGYKKQLLMNRILIDKPTVLFDRKFLKVQIEPLGSSTVFIPLVCTFIGLFLSILIIILFKNARFIK